MRAKVLFRQRMSQLYDKSIQAVKNGLIQGLWIFFKPYSHLKSIAMTNKELLQASLLDILFDGRNKEYGAYSLRKSYSQRLGLSLALGMSLIFLFIFLNSFKGKTETVAIEKKPDVTLSTVVIPEEPIEPPPPQPDVPPPVATTEFVNMVVVPDDKADDYINSIDDLDGKQISTADLDGDRYDKVLVEEVVPPTIVEEKKPEVVYVPKPSSAPEYPGGMEALRKFLGNNIRTPDELQAGETKVVRVKFVVDKEGAISTIEIVASGGNVYDKEVIRVCRKMPRWRPAIQNGEPATMSYVLPVTFMGLEQ